MSKKRPRPEPEPIVLGLELAAAATAERERRVHTPADASPLRGARYRFACPALSLLRPVAVPTDARVAAVVQAYAEADAASRSATRAALRMDDFYTLLAFAQRSALFAIRENDAARLAAGLTAVAMIEAERVDWRDAVVALGVLAYAATRIAADLGRLVGDAVRRAEPGMAEILRRFRHASAEDRNLRSWGYAEVETADGVGFVQGGLGRARSKCDLLGIAIDLAECLGRDRYRVNSIDFGGVMPRVWLEHRDNADLDAAMGKVRSGLSLDASLRRTPGISASSQHFAVFLMEMKTEPAARDLLGVARQKKAKWFCKVAVAEGPVFCLTVARSFVEGAAAYETPASLARFEESFLEILKRRLAAA